MDPIETLMGPIGVLIRSSYGIHMGSRGFHMGFMLAAQGLVWFP